VSSDAGTVKDMNLTWLLTFMSAIATLVGLFAVALPVRLLESKGATVSAAAIIWMREVGVLVFAQGLTCFLLRNQSLSPAVRAFLVGAAVTQLGLLPIELTAYWRGSLTKLSGILPNSVLHAVLGSVLLYRALS
jgi:hypothetical protein